MNIQMTRRAAVGLKLGASASNTSVNVSSRGTLDQAILQIPAGPGMVWRFRNNSPISGGVERSGRISAAGLNGTYSVLRVGNTSRYLQVTLGSRTYVYQAIRHIDFHLNPTYRSSATTAPRNVHVSATPDDDFSQDRKDRETHDAETLGGVRVVQGAHTLSSEPTLGAADQATINAAAIAMNDALNAHGYKISDRPLYMAFQTAYYPAGTVADGYPGTDTMNQLSTVLSALGVTMANVPIYPWSASGGYDGVNAPLMSQWDPSNSGGGTTTTTTTTTSTTNNIFAGMPVWAKWVVGAAAVGGAYVVGKAAYKKHGGTVRGHATRLHARLRHHARRLTHRPA